MRRVLIFTALLFCVAALCLPASASGYRNGKISIVTEPETFSSEDVTYYQGDTQMSADQLTWVENGYEGKALKLSGNGEFLRLWYTAVRVPEFTFSAMVNWQGGASGQRLFTIARGTTNYVTFSPYMYDESIADNGIVNGVYMRYQFGGENGTVFDMFNPTTEDLSYRLPEGEWHHVAMVSDGNTLKLYIDGVRWFEEQVLTSLAEVGPHSLDIGSGEWGDPTLNALLDNVEIYRSALSEEKIQELAGMGSGTAYLPTRPTTTTTESTAEPTATTTPTTTYPRTLSATLWGMPLWGVYMLVGIVVLYVILTVVTNVLRKREGDGRP